MRSLAVLGCLAAVVALEFTFFRMVSAEKEVAGEKQSSFEKMNDIRVNHCDLAFWSATRYCDGVFLLHGEPTVSTVTYACDAERCKFECGN